MKIINHSLYIAGRWVEPAGGGYLSDIVDPASGQAIAQMAFASDRDVDLAVEAAHAAFPSYSRSPLGDRIALLERICAIYERRLPDIAKAVTREMGAPYESFSLPLQAASGLWHFQTALATARDFPFERMINATTKLVREPVGVSALITPWNWPLNQVVVKVAPALVTGCTMVLKPSQNSALSAAIVAEILDEAGVPEGVFNMVQGEGNRLGHRLASHPLVDMVSLTGSNTAGAATSHAAADTFKRVSLELGGKSANIILPDAELEAAIAHAVRHMMSNSGQSCNAPSRLLVPQSLLSEVEAQAAEVADALVVGDPFAVGTDIGPIANERQFRRVNALIEQGISEGARCVAGGPAASQEPGAGYYVRPTILVDEANDTVVSREEIFGPVLVIIPYRDEDHAVEIANDTPFGLSGYVWGSTVERASETATRLRTGMVHLNGASVDFAAPFGGYKQSGNGREWGAWGLEDFLETKAVMGVVP